MATDISIYALQTNAEGRVSLAQVVTLPVGLLSRPSFTAVTEFSDGGQSFVALYKKGESTVDLYQSLGSAPWVQRAGSVVVGSDWDLMEGFQFGNVAHLMMYRADLGQFTFFPLNAALQSDSKYTYARSHPPGTSQGFDMIRPFVLGGTISYMGYSSETGNVAIYNLFSTATSPDGIAPLVGHLAWGYQWAPGWTRFAFFHLAGAPYFLKTNIVHPNVNIDHVQDVAANGTTEVATRMALTDAQNLSVVEPFVLDHGTPHFMAYRPDGLAVVYRIYSDCTGWTPIATENLTANAKAIVPVAINGSQFFLLFPE